MNTSFKPSEFDKQAAASLEMMDVEGATERVQAILHPQAGATTSKEPAKPPTPLETLMRPSDSRPVTLRIRKKRSDADTHKPKAPADPDEIVLLLTLTEARMVALGDPDFGISAKIHDQIIAQLQRRLDQLQKAPK